MTPAEAWGALKQHTKIDYLREHVLQPDPVPFGVGPLDRALAGDGQLGGMPCGTFTVLAGEPGAGKSALACVAAYESAMGRVRPAVFFSLEMPAHQVISRMLSIHTNRRRKAEMAEGVPEAQLTRQVWWSTTNRVVRRLAGRTMETDADLQAYLAAHTNQADPSRDDPVLAAWEDFQRTAWPGMVVHEGARTVSECVSAVDEICEAGIRPLVVLDYLQLGADMDGEGSEYERVTRASGKLLGCAKRWQIPMLVVSSMRNVGRDEAKDAPRLSWLRSSGRIGFDAGTVVMLRRSGERDGAAQPVEAHVVKNRVGPCGGSCELKFLGGLNVFE